MKPEPDFDALCLSFSPLIKKTIRYVGLQQDYQEAYQGGLIALWEAWRDFDPQKGFFPPYAKAKITGKLRTLATKTYQHRERFVTFSIGEEPSQEIEPSWEAFSFDFEKCKLSGKEKLWIKEYIQEGFNTEEIASRYHVSTHTVRSWKKGVKRKLKAHYLNN